MKKRLLIFTILIIISIFFFLTAFYFIVAYNYQSGFTYGTWINGIYCTNRTVEDVNKELVSKYQTHDIVISSEKYKDEIIKMTELNFSVDYTSELTKIKQNQKPYEWYKNLNKYEIEPIIYYDHDLLVNKIKELGIIKYYNPDNEYTVSIVYGEDGYELYDDRRECLDYLKIVNLFESAVTAGTNVIISNDYFDPCKTNHQFENTYRLWNVVSDYITPRFTIDMGKEVISIDRKFLSDFLVVNEKGFVFDSNRKLIYSEEKINSYLDSLLTPYNTYGLPRDYKTYYGEIKHFETTLYGTLINIDKEKEYILDAILNKKEEEYIPTYKKRGYVRGLDDIGGEYIEVDLTNQKLLYVKDYKLIMETDVVTGNPNAGSATPEMLTYINKKVRNAVLIGENYVSPVDYWMAILGTTIGLHDAKWQRAFGGSRYLTHGSHGCVNMIYEDVASLYDMVEVGVPVIVYK